MMPNNDLILKWIRKVSSIDRLQMDADALAEDVLLLANVYIDPVEFDLVMENVVNGLKHLVNNQEDSSQLDHNYTGWNSYHFQSKRTQGQKADLRIVYQMSAGSICVKGIGDRRIQADIYERLSQRK